MQNSDIFILVLRLNKYNQSRVLTRDLCGRGVEDWVNDAVSEWKHKFVDTDIDTDILTIFRDNITSAKYTVVTYSDMPLLSAEAIQSAIDYLVVKNLPAVALPRGWVFNTELVANNDNFNVINFPIADPMDYMVAFNEAQIAKIRPVMQERINTAHIKNGVHIIAPENTYIDYGATIESGTTIEPNVYIKGTTSIGKETTILSGTRIEEATIGSSAKIGPHAHIRPNSKIGNGAKIGNYVEIKNSTIGDATKVAHMTYVGDSTIGLNCNIGCGVIFCNYDGKKKNHTTVGDNVFMGSNVCLIAPVTIGSNAVIAAGSVIDTEVPANALGIARARQAIKENYASE